MPTIDITPEIRRLARGTAFERDDAFLVAIATAIAELGAGAHRTDVLARASEDRIRALQAEADEAEAKGRQAGAQAERTRIASILTSREAEGREAVARSLAFASDMPAAAAIEALKMAPTKPAWPAPAAQPAEPPKLDGILRAADAPGGLVIVGPDGEPALAEGPVVSVSPEPPRRAGENTAKALWKTVIDDVNKSASAAPAQANAGRSAVAHLNHTAN